MQNKEFLRKLLSPAARKPRTAGPSKFAWVRDSETKELYKLPLNQVPSSAIGSFQGKAGSIRRNNKGGTRRLANGRRKFVRDWGSQVVSYKA